MRWLIVFIALCLCLPAEAETGGTFAVVGEKNAQLLSTDSGMVLAYLAAGSWVEIAGNTPDYYLAVSTDGNTGYIRKDEVQVAEIRRAGMGEVTNPSAREYLNLREGPSLQAEVVEICYSGTPFVILGHSGDGWYHVRVNGEEGYFREEFVTERASWPYGEKVATVHATGQSGVNMRTGPGYGYPAIRTCADGAFLTVLRQGNDWWMVSDREKIGFVRSSFLYDGVLNPVYQSSAVSGAVAIVSNPKATQVLNLREMPSRNSDSLKQYSNGTELTLLQQGTEWCRVTDRQGNIGYCMTDYLTLKNAPVTPTKTVSHPDGTYVNLRNAPSMTGTWILCEVPHGQVVTVLIPDVDGWTRVEYNGQQGFMASMFLQ